MLAFPLHIIDGALNELADLVTLREVPGPTSHTAVVAEGLDDPAVPAALGRYLLGVLAGAVQLDARLSEKYMLSGVSDHEEIIALLSPGRRREQRLRDGRREGVSRPDTQRVDR